jgi:hypothetical protein
MSAGKRISQQHRVADVTLLSEPRKSPKYEQGIAMGPLGRSGATRSRDREGSLFRYDFSNNAKLQAAQSFK